MEVYCCVILSIVCQEPGALMPIAPQAGQPFNSCSAQTYVLYFWIQKEAILASLVVQWLRIRLSMQGTRVRALVWEDPTCRRAARPMSHNY